ncbi:MAG: T9SS type A sorting domain-containing protein [candidate division WOR-3 bacterium]
MVSNLDRIRNPVRAGRLRLLLVLLVPVVAAAQLDTMWTRRYPEAKPATPRPSYVADILADADGGVYLCGGGNYPGPENEYLLTAKYDEFGNRIWLGARTGASTDAYDNLGHAIVADPTGNVYVVGCVDDPSPNDRDMAWLKYTGSGSEEWFDTLNLLDEDILYDAVVAADGFIYACGVRWNNTLATNEFLVAKLNPANGDTVWTRGYVYTDPPGSGPGRDRPKVLKKQRPPRRFRLYPNFYDEIEDWENCATALALAPDGNIVVTGVAYSDLNDKEWWTMKFTPAGVRLWDRTYHNPQTLYEDDDIAFDVVVANNGNIYVAGFDYLETDDVDQWRNFCVVRYDANGQFCAYQSRDGAEGEDCAFALCLDDASPQNVYVTGWAEYSTSVQILTHKFDWSLSSRLWAGGARFGSADGDEYGCDIFYKSRRVYVVGNWGRNVAAVCYRDSTTTPRAPTPLWSFVFPGTGASWDMGTAVWVNDTDHVYVAGQTFQQTGTTVWSSMFLSRLFYRVNDVGADQILAPVGEIPLDTLVRPKVRIRNYGNSATICSLHVVVRDAGGTPVYDVAEKGIFVPMDGIDYELATPWQAGPVGSYDVIANTYLTGDGVPGNDTCRSTCTVVKTDVGVTSISVPVGPVPLDTVLRPTVRIENFGSKTATFNIRFVIDDGTEPPEYDETETGIVLPPGGNATHEFARTWAAGPLGEYGTLAYTIMPGDQNPGNDTSRGTCTVTYTDAGVTAINAPAGDIRRDSLVAPEVVITNFGTQAAELDCRLVVFAAADTVYDTTETGIIVPAGSPVTHQFDLVWSAKPQGEYSVSAFTMLPRDQNRANDTTYGSCSVIYTDAGVAAIAEPAGNVGNGTEVSPRVIIRNYGNREVTLDLRFVIDDGIAPPEYDETETGIVLSAGATVPYSFSTTWTATPAGTYLAKAYTILDGDQEPQNDTAQRTFRVVQVDAGVTEIVVPVGGIEEGTEVMPEVVVKNFGPSTITTDVRLIIDDGIAPPEYDQTETDVVVGPGAQVNRQFAVGWTASPTGDYVTKAYTMLEFDEDPSNDTASGSCRVKYTDAGATAVNAPVGDIRLGTQVRPEAVLANFGTDEVVTDVRLVIEDEAGDEVVYDTIETGILLPVGSPVIRTFKKTWITGPRLGNYRTRCYTMLAGDRVPANDTAKAVCRVVEAAAVDAAVLQVLAPAGRLDTNEAVVPQARVANLGNVPISFTTWFVIEDERADGEQYRASVSVVDLSVGKESTLAFVEWLGTASEGRYVALCSLALADENPENDTASRRFRVSAQEPWPEGWVEVESLPRLPSQRSAKDGAWLAENRGLVYAAKGYKTGDFYRYWPNQDSWEQLESIPSLEQGRYRPPKDGCRGIGDGESSIFMIKGANTLGFWRYGIESRTWERLPDVPEGPSHKRIKYGADLVYVNRNDTGWVYLLKGYKTEFYRYNVIAQRWDTLDNAPARVRDKYNKGSFLVYAPPRYIYCHQPYYYDRSAPTPHHYMFKYDLDADTWCQSTLTGLPLYGLQSGRMRKKKAKDGSAGAWFDEHLYALKGGNTQQFYWYFPDGDSWQELDTMPSVGSTGKRKYVKYGGDLVACRDALWALKGNKTREFWRYGPRFGAKAAAGQPMRGGEMAVRSAFGSIRLTVSPNPIGSGRATLMCSLPKPGPVSVRVCDAAGRCIVVCQLVAKSRRVGIPLDVRSLSSGVYLVQLDAGQNFRQTAKFIVR